MTSVNSERLPTARNVNYLSAPVAVSMADSWFEIASADHFWIRRRFEVLRRLAGGLITGSSRIAEVGCGHGLLQSGIEEAYGREVTGFDLNEFALNQNVSRLSAVYCYDIYDKNPRFREHFDLLLLFDVLEHIPDENSFLPALAFHLAREGRIIINVPAGHWAYSAYDRAAGHVRRYSIRSFRKVAGRNNLEISDWTYWGLPLIPSLLLRKLWLLGRRNESNIISAGFDPRNPTINRLLEMVSGWEPIPQRLAGTSLMAVLQAVRRPA